MMIAVATWTYALGKELGFAEATAEFQRQLGAPDWESLPCVRVITRLRGLLADGDEISLYHDAAATIMSKARSRAYHAAAAADADVWICVDDDVEADLGTLRSLLEAVSGDTPRLVLAPCITRGSNVVNVALEPGAPLVRVLDSGARCVRARAGGFGLVALNRAAMKLMETAYAGLTFDDDDGQSKMALFLELLDGGSWMGEDVAFCRRAVLCGVALEALIEGFTVHAGARLDLAEVAGMPVLGGPAASPDPAPK
jgi:hypothetical protein